MEEHRRPAEEMLDMLMRRVRTSRSVHAMKFGHRVFEQREDYADASKTLHVVSERSEELLPLFLAETNFVIRERFPDLSESAYRTGLMSQWISVLPEVVDRVNAVIADGDEETQQILNDPEAMEDLRRSSLESDENAVDYEVIRQRRGLAKA